MPDLCQDLSSLEAVGSGVKGTDLQGDQPRNEAPGESRDYEVPQWMSLAVGRIMRSYEERLDLFPRSSKSWLGAGHTKSNWTTPSTWVISYSITRFHGPGPWRECGHVSRSRPRNTNPEFRQQITFSKSVVSSDQIEFHRMPMPRAS
jgi:hypothetical protein